MEKLADNGIIAFHISNRYLKLQPCLAKLAENTSPKLIARHWDDTNADLHLGRLASQWVVLARSEADLGALGLDTRWEELRSEPNTPLWTDDFSNLLSAFKW